MDLIIYGKKKGKKEFKKKIKSDITFLDLSKKKLSKIDLSPLEHCYGLITLNLQKNNLDSINLEPLQHCKKLVTLKLENNLLDEIDLAPIVHCKNLIRLRIDKRVSIRWFDEHFDVFDLSSGLRTYMRNIRKAHKQHLEFQAEERAKRAVETAPEKIASLLNQFRPSVPITLKRIASLAEIPIDLARTIIVEIITKMPEIGEYLELEDVFLRKTETDIEIDILVSQFQEWNEE